MVGICKHDSSWEWKNEIVYIAHSSDIFVNNFLFLLEIFISMQTLNAASNSSLGYFCVFEDTFFLSL